MENHYTILGIEATASKDDIKRAYRELALKYHPDQHPSAIANELFRRIKEAYEVLSDDARRAAYDNTVRVATGGPTKEAAAKKGWECPRCSLLWTSARFACECGYRAPDANTTQSGPHPQPSTGSNAADAPAPDEKRSAAVLWIVLAALGLSVATCFLLRDKTDTKETDTKTPGGLRQAP